MSKYSDKLIRVAPCGHGHWRVTFKHRHRFCSAVITDAYLIDRYNNVRVNRERGYEKWCKAIVMAALNSGGLKDE